MSSPGQTRRRAFPIGQLSILLFLRFCESASTSVIFPFLKELLASLTGGQQASVGYYVGIMEFTRQAVSLAVVMYWSRLSDRIGRKPILVMGTFALSVSMFSFGLSTSFWGLVLSRCIFTGFNSNAGVIKGMIGEITDQNNSADAFALLHVPWAIGYSLGAFLGGSLARPFDRFPSLFWGRLWQDHPYFLPCFVMSLLSLCGCFVIVWLRETVKDGWFGHHSGEPSPSFSHDEDSSEPLLHPSEEAATPERRAEDVPSVRSLLTPETVPPILIYTLLAGLHASSNTLQPIFLALPVSMGGLALPPSTIGLILGVAGLGNAAFQAGVLGRVVRRWGVKSVLRASMLAGIGLCGGPVVVNLLLKAVGWENSWVVWIAIAWWLLCGFILELGYGCLYIFITHSSPQGKHTLGAINGLAQTSVSVGRIVLPAIASSLLSFAIEHKILGGYVPYMTLACGSFGGFTTVRYLPEI